MKILPLTKTINNFKGKPITQSTEEVDEKNRPLQIPMTLKDIYLHYLGIYSSQKGKQVIAAYKLGIVISDCQDPTIQLENADFLLLKEATQTPQHGALVMGQLYEALEEAEKEPEK